MKKEALEKYNPAKFRELKQADIDAMKDLTKDDVAELARLYPNKPSDRAYLVLFNTKDKAKQLYPLSTWQNLHALWRQGILNFVAFNFAALHNSRTARGNEATKVAPLQDLTQAEVKRELKNIPNNPTFPVTRPEQLKTAPIQTAKKVVAGDDLASDSDIDEPVYSDSDLQIDEEILEKEAEKKAKKKAEPKTVKPVPVKKNVKKEGTKKQ